MINNSCHGFPCCWTSCDGIQNFLRCSIYFCPHTRFVWDVACIMPLCSVIFVSRFAHATVLSRTRNSIDQLAWETWHNYTVPCQRYPTSVWEHHSCHMQVSSILQQCMEDDLVLVVGDIQHHGSHHKIVLEGKLFWDQYEKDPIFLLAAMWQLIRNLGLVEAWESVCEYSFCLSWKPLNTHLVFALRNCLVCPSWWWAPIVRSHKFSAWPSSCRWDQKTSLSTQGLYSRCFVLANCL